MASAESLAAARTDGDAALDKVRAFWETHVHDWKIAKSAPGTASFFREIEAYRYEKLHYLPNLVDFSAYADKLLLDVGCGVGNDLARFAQGGARAVGIDLAPYSIELAKSNFSQRKLQGEFHVMNGEAMQFPAQTFDVVFCHTVLHFTPHPERMISEIWRVLKPGGTAIIMTVNRRSWLNFMHRVAKVKIDHLDAPVFHRYTIAEFRELLRVFSEVKIVPERFPVATKVHRGLKASLFNALFVGGFSLLPRAWVRKSGHHLVAFCTKSA